MAKFICLACGLRFSRVVPGGTLPACRCGSALVAKIDKARQERDAKAIHAAVRKVLKNF